MENKESPYANVKRCKICGRCPCITINEKESKYSIACEYCNVETGNFDTKEKSVEVWNNLNTVTEAEITEDKNYFAKLIAAVVKNCMEEFQEKHLTDEQMKELNPIIQNAIYTALVRVKEYPNAMRVYYRSHVANDLEDCRILRHVDAFFNKIL